MLELILATDPRLQLPSAEKTAAVFSSGAFGGAERAARGIAAVKGGLPGVMGNMGIRSGAGLGALAGMAYGAMSPGKDDEGNERGIISGAARGAVRGTLMGGALGGLGRHLSGPTINQHLPAARAEMRAGPAPAAAPVPTTAPINDGKMAEAQALKEEMKVSSTGIKVPVLSIRG